MPPYAHSEKGKEIKKKLADGEYASYGNFCKGIGKAKIPNEEKEALKRAAAKVFGETAPSKPAKKAPKKRAAKAPTAKKQKRQKQKRRARKPAEAAPEKPPRRVATRGHLARHHERLRQQEEATNDPLYQLGLLGQYTGSCAQAITAIVGAQAKVPGLEIDKPVKNANDSIERSTAMGNRLMDEMASAHQPTAPAPPKTPEVAEEGNTNPQTPPGVMSTEEALKRFREVKPVTDGN